MSEPSSLYIRVKLTQESLEVFKASPLAAPSRYSDWRPWLDSKKFHGEISDAEIQSLNPANEIARFPVHTFGDYLSLLAQDVSAAPVQAQYDPLSNTWTLCVMGLSENYKDFLLVLALLRGIALYKDLPGEDFILIYPYFWEENAGAYANAYVTLSAGGSRLVDEIPASAIQEANQALGKMLAEFRSSYSEDEL
jgi:hypothetical protein